MINMALIQIIYRRRQERKYTLCFTCKINDFIYIPTKKKFEIHSNDYNLPKMLGNRNSSVFPLTKCLNMHTSSDRYRDGCYGNRAKLRRWMTLRKIDPGHYCVYTH